MGFVFSDPAQLYQKGMEYQIDEDWYSAIEMYQSALKENRSYNLVYQGLAECFYALNEYDQALTYVLSARSFKNNDPVLQNLHGFILIGLNKPNDAKELFQSVLKTYPNNPEARFGLAEIEILNGKLYTASEMYKQALSRQGENRKALLSLALVSYTAGNMTQAEDYISRALEYHGDNYQVHYFAAYLSALKGELENAEGRLYSAIQLKTDYDDAYALLASVLYAQKRYEEAIKISDIRISKKRERADAWYLKTLCLLKLNKSRDAMISAKVGLSIDPENEIMRVLLEETAIATLNFEDKFRMELAKYHAERGLGFARRNITDKALYEYRRALKVYPYDVVSREAYAQILLRMGYPSRYLEQMLFIQSIVKSNKRVNDAVETYSKTLLTSLQTKWKIDPLYLNKAHISIGLFYEMESVNVIHPEAEKITQIMAADIFSHNPRLKVTSYSNESATYTQAFKKSRAANDDYFGVVKLRENERDIQLLRLKGFIESLGTKKQSTQNAEEKRNSIQAQIDGINDMLSENMDIVNEMEGMLTASQLKIASLASEQRNKKDQVQIYNTQRSQLKYKLNQLEAKTASIKEAAESLKDDISEKSSAVFEFKKQVADIEKNAAEFEQNIKLAGCSIDLNKEKIEKAEKEIKNLEAARIEKEAELRAVTEDIVTELDQNLRSAGYSSANRLEAETALGESLNRLKIFLNGRKNIFSDFAGLHTPAPEDVKRFAGNAVESFDSLLQIVAELETCLEKYKKSSAGFIDDFLAPEGIITKKRAVDAAILQNRQSIEKNRTEIANLIAENNELSVKIDDYKKTLENLRISKTKIEANAANAESQVKLLERQLLSQQNLLKEAEDEIFSETKRLNQIDETLTELEGEINSLEIQGRKLADELEKLQNDISEKNSDLASKRGKISKLTEELSKANSLLEKFHDDLIGIEADIRNLKDNFREKYSRDLMEFEERMFALNISPGDLKTELSSIKQKLEALGNPNLMAPEEFEEVKTRYEFLNKQIGDLEKARSDLQRITDEITAESTELFLSTYNKIKKNFHNMFRRLYGGGRAEIRLTDPQNVLESGIEIFAQPPGKKLENINLLSGGEKSITAVAILFATYMVKPSPFCLLDEIDAALDEPNVVRFVTTLREFANVSQYIVITHNKKTVLGANTMLGVTMEEAGVSKVIAVKLDKESEISAKQQSVDIIDEPFIEEEVEPEQGIYIPPHPSKRIKTINGQKEEVSHDE